MPLTDAAAHASFTDLVRVRSDRLHDVAWLVTDVGSALHPNRVSVRVFGEGKIGGLAKLTGLRLRAYGCHVLSCTETTGSARAGTTIRGAAADSPEVKLVALLFPGNDRREYGKLAAGASSDYIDVPAAYRYAWVQVVASGRELGRKPADYVGEKDLQPGLYTHGLTIDGDAVNLALTIDG